MGNCDISQKNHHIKKTNKLSKSKTYYKIGKSYQNSQDKIKLEFSLENCEYNSRYSIFVQDGKEVFETETVNCHYNPIIIFNTFYICNFTFERKQILIIIIKKNNNIIGTFQPALGLIVGSKNCTLVEKVNSEGPELIKITGQGITDTNSFLYFNFFIKTNNIDFSIQQNKISYVIISNKRKIYKSELISDYGQFKSAKIPSTFLEPSFTIIFLDNYKNEISYKNETINSFISQNSPFGFYHVIQMDNGTINIFNNSQLLRNFTFIDYLKNGVKLNLSIGIDFTSSNGDPTKSNSLHYISNYYKNDYEEAIRACGLIMAYYDRDQLFPVYGFGAVIKDEQPPSMCFNINFKNDPEIYTIDNVIKEYQKCLQRIILAGPTKFYPIIRNTINTIYKQNMPLKYHVLMILTDGIILDLQETIDVLVEGSFLPLSVIIIGVGNDHFQEMEILDGDNVPLVSSIGIKRMRDLVQFVPYNKYKNNPQELMAQVLEEIPRQIVEYYTMNNLYPNNLSMAKLRTQNTINRNFKI